jgi:septum formation protein
MLGLEFTVVPPEDEEPIGEAPPGETVAAIARGKARSVAARFPGDVIIAADTLVFLDGGADGRVLGKPGSIADAWRMLQTLSGRWHEVYTGVCVRRGDYESTEFERTRVKFRDLSGDEIARYIATGEPMDKAGAYGAQGRGAAMIERIEGDFFNVMGLPVCKLTIMLRDYGIQV